MLKVCVNGARPLTDHPALSLDPAVVAHEAARAVRAGATAVHVHPKDAAGADSLAEVDVRRFVEAIREACPGVPVGVTTGAWAVPDPTDRVAAVARWTVLPDFASVNFHEAGADAVAATLLDRGVAIEAGVWNRQGLEAWQRSAVLLDCLRVLIELPDQAADGAASSIERIALPLIDAVRTTAPEISILLHGEGESAWPAIELAHRLALDTRVGLEDTLYLPDGRLALDNADLVRAALALTAQG